MKSTVAKLAASMAAIPASLLLIGITQNGFFFLFTLISLPLAVLYWIDLGRQLRNVQGGGRMMRLLGIVMGVPQALFGLAVVLVGLAIIGWVLYNTFVERQEQYSGGLMTLGIGPVLVLFGTGWLRSAFRGHQDPADQAG